MSKATFELTAELRLDQGKGASRRLRRTKDQIPGIVYGGTDKPTLIMLDHKKLMHALEHEAFYSHLLTLHLPNKKQQVVLKAIQRHHFKRALLHVDFQRVSANDVITMRVPLHFIGTAPGIKMGGEVSHLINEVEIKCKASQLPEFIEIDISHLELGQALHLSDIKLKNNVEIPALTQGHDSPVVNVHTPETRTLDEPAAAVSAAVPAANQKAPESATSGSTSDRGKGKDKGK